jgi:hypothetical protein
LRHCDELQTPNATGFAGKAGARFEARSQDIGLNALVWPRIAAAKLLRQEKDEASPPIVFGGI